MAWRGVTPIAAGEESGGLYPTLRDDLSVMLEPEESAEKESVVTTKALGVTMQRRVNGEWVRVFHADDIPLVVYTTNRRLVVYCKKWTKGGFIGTTGPIGLAVALTTAAVSGAAAARKRKGTALAGHIRWEWVALIAWRRRAFGQRNALVLQTVDCTDGRRSECRLIIEFSGYVDEVTFAKGIARRVAKRWLDSDTSMTDEDREKWERTASDPQWEVRGKTVSILTLPRHHLLTAEGVPAEVAEQSPAPDPS